MTELPGDIFLILCCLYVQMLATVVVLWVGKATKVISFPDCDETIPRKVMVTSALYNICSFKEFSFRLLSGFTDIPSTSPLCGKSDHWSVWNQKAEVSALCADLFKLIAVDLVTFDIWPRS